MKKRLFLLILTLVGMCPAVYCADHEENQFQRGLPLSGAEIRYPEISNSGYATCLGWLSGLVGASLIYLIMSKSLPFVIEQVMPLLYTNNEALIDATGCILAIGTAIPVCILLAKKIEKKSHDILDQSSRSIKQAKTLHNIAVAPSTRCMGTIVKEENGYRSLLIPMNDIVRTYPLNDIVHTYPFDLWRSERQETVSKLSWLDKLFLGPGDLDRIRAVNEELDALGDQLHPIQNVKRAYR